MSPLILYPFISFILTIILIRLARWLACKAGLVDQPGGRKQHDGSIPLIGGLVIVPVFILISSFVQYDWDDYWPLYFALTILMICGAVDDFSEVRAWVKFLIQFCAALLIVIPGQAHLYQLGNLFGFGDFGLGFMALPFSLAAVMLLINAVNLMDGLDGLAAGTSFIALFWLVIVFSLTGVIGYAMMILILMAALLGFLLYNLRTPIHKKASIFLGDAGSLCLGLLLAWFCITSSKLMQTALQPISVAWILALPIMDTCAQFYRRVREGRHPFSPDRGHFHHHFIDAGFSPGQATAFIMLIVFMTGAIGVLLPAQGVPAFVLTILWIVAILAHIFISEKPERYIQLFTKLRKFSS